MSAKVFFLHTVSGLVEGFRRLCAELIPEAAVCHISDESLIQGVLAAGGLTPAIYRRVCDHVVAAEQAGADVIQLTCSSVSPCVEVARYLVSVPVLKIDEPVIERAVRDYRRVGIIATAPTTLKPSSDLIRRKAAEAGRQVEIDVVLCEGAYAAFLAGDADKADGMVLGQLRDLIKRVDVVLLAQASMERVADRLAAAERTVPVLSSPRPAVERLAEVLADLPRAGGA
jgi:Asp/Glu/hydantoin racemase